MGERKSFVVQLRDATQAIVATAAVFALLGGMAVKAWAWVKAGPTALTETQVLKRDMRRLKRQNRFMIRGIEKLTKEKYDWRQEEREMARPEEEIE